MIKHSPNLTNISLNERKIFLQRGKYFVSFEPCFVNLTSLQPASKKPSERGLSFLDVIVNSSEIVGAVSDDHQLSSHLTR